LRHYSDFGFADPDNARSYAASGPRPFLPGIDAMHTMTVQLLEETMSTSGHVLVLGAGGGHELRAFSRARPDWQFTAVDPSPQMLTAAPSTLSEIHRRLEPGAAFVLVDNCLDFASPEADRGLARYMAYARSQGAPEEMLSSLRTELPVKSESIAEARELELLGQAGFRDVELFYAGLSWRGWVAFAAD